jgi:hypothetical protein
MAPRKWRPCKQHRPAEGRVCFYGDRCTYLHDGTVPPAYQNDQDLAPKVKVEEEEEEVPEVVGALAAMAAPTVERGRRRGSASAAKAAPAPAAAALPLIQPHPDAVRTPEQEAQIAKSRAQARCRHHAPWLGKTCRRGADCNFAHHETPPANWIKSLASSLNASLPALQEVVSALQEAVKGGADGAVVDRQSIVAHWLRAEAQQWLLCSLCSSESLRTPRTVWVGCGHRGPCLRCLRSRDGSVRASCRDCGEAPVAALKLGDRSSAGYAKRLHTSDLTGATYDEAARVLASSSAADELRDTVLVASACAVPLVIAHLSLRAAEGDLDKARESLSPETLLGSVNLGKLQGYASAVDASTVAFRTFTSLGALVDASEGLGTPSRVPRAESPPSNSSASRVLEHFGSPDAHASSSVVRDSPVRRQLAASFAQAEAEAAEGAAAAPAVVVDGTADAAAAEAKKAAKKEARAAKKKAAREAKAAAQAAAKKEKEAAETERVAAAEEAVAVVTPSVAADEPAVVQATEVVVDDAAAPISSVATKGSTPQSSLASSGKHTPPALPVVVDSPTSSSLTSLGAALTLDRLLAAVPRDAPVGSVAWVAALVRAAGLREEHVSLFEMEEIDLAAFAILADADLREMGLRAKGPRLKVMRLVREVAVCTGIEDLEGRSMMSSDAVSASMGERSQSTAPVPVTCDYCGRADHASSLCTESFIFRNGNVVRPMTPGEVAARNKAQGYMPRDADATSYGETMSATSACAFCNAPAVDLCSACMDIYYCSPMCQLMHWQDHKLVCRQQR